MPQFGSYAIKRISQIEANTAKRSGLFRSFAGDAAVNANEWDLSLLSRSRGSRDTFLNLNVPTIYVQYKYIYLSMSTVTNDSSTFAWYGWVVRRARCCINGGADGGRGWVELAT